MMPRPRLAGALIPAMAFLSYLRPESWEPCVEVVPNITYQCMEKNLYKIPDNIPFSTKNLDLSFNLLEHLGSHSFLHVSELHFLDLSRCKIHTIEDDAYQGLKNLSTLILTGNPIQSLSPRAFSGLSNLQKLVAVETHLTSLGDFPIGHLKTLKELNVAHNLIHSFSIPDYFSNLSSLEHLDLSNNKIQHIYHKDLRVLHQKPLGTLSLDLSLNPIDFIQPGAFEAIRLHELILKSNFKSTSIMKICIQGLSGLKVHRLVLGEFKNERTIKNFDKSALEGLCNLAIEEFRLAHIDDLEDNITDLFDCLENVSVMALVHMYIDNQEIFPKDFSWESLEFINCEFSENIFFLKLSSLRRLTFTDNKGVRTFPELNTPSLEFLDISNNGLSFQSCCSVNSLRLTQLKHLNLSFNGVITMTSNFVGLEQLESLHFQHSNLRNINEFSVFLSLNSLLYLDISYTNIRVAFRGIFDGLHSLRVLKMAGNAFQDNRLLNIFTEMTNLAKLDLSSCQLEQVYQGAFESLPRLESLNMSHNNLLVLDTLTYKCLYSLRILDLSFNRIGDITEPGQQHFPSNLTLLHLTKNAFVCDCEHQIFMQWIKDQKWLLVEVEQMVCITPPDMPVLSFTNATCQISKTIISVSVFSVLVVSFAVVLVYKFYFHLMLLVGRRKYGRGESVYDAFVIYSSQDEDWVRNELVKNLEEGVPPFRLCLHYRDFIPGVAIAANIIQEGFHKSRKVIVVVSQHFIQSRWCIFEYEIAQTWQFLSSHAGIIFIVLQKVEKSLLRQRVELYRLLSRNTYLEWEDNVLGRHIFWRRLRKALLDGKTLSPEGMARAENNQQEAMTLI